MSNIKRLRENVLKRQVQLVKDVVPVMQRAVLARRQNKYLAGALLLK